jgi:hypothetical protein
MRFILAWLALWGGGTYAASPFERPELRVAASPPDARRLELPPGFRVLDTDVSPLEPVTALLLLKADGTREVQLWDVHKAAPTKTFDVPAGLQARSLVWHPEGNAIFLAGPAGQRFAIYRADRQAEQWTSRQIFSSAAEIRRLTVGPRPFVTDFNPVRKVSIQHYRLFFGSRLANGNYTTHAITDEGKSEYLALGPKSAQIKLPDNEFPPSEIVADYALPVGFHPAGHILTWEDAKHCFQAVRYDGDHWGRTERLLGREICGGTVSATPNGAGVLHWESGKPGVELLLDRGATVRRVAESYQLVSAPSSTADGRGIVGVIRTDGGFAVTYIPIDVPLADVVNAWMFTEASDDVMRFVRDGGLFRNLNSFDQLYQLYDTEMYNCGGFDAKQPTRPYLVTTDIFWELWAAAYEGLFIVRERQVAIPAFWSFVGKATAALKQTRPQSKWATAFEALTAFHSGVTANPESQRIARASGSATSSVLGTSFDYGELKPRGNYTATPASRAYFQAFRYLTRIGSELPPDDLVALPADVKAAAMGWVSAYAGMIAPSRAPLAWGASRAVPEYVRHPVSRLMVFPLAWGFDNEALFSSVYHADLPAEERIEGPSGGRLTPSALDVAAALGSRFARGLLASELSRYPNLAAALDSARDRHAQATSGAPTLYERWLDSLAAQWADGVASPGGASDAKLWRTKRLQTGLASWATLRHATVLVNERVSAECGEGGFEEIVMRPPRGYVEPDPAAFERIGALFDAAVKMVSAPDTRLTGTMPAGEDEPDGAKQALQQGLVKRLSATAQKARLFASMAAKQLRGEALTPAEYEEILFVGRVAEHHFLVFKSLANADLALSNPKPMPKVVDVADVQGSAPYLMSAVGRPLEWDHVVPYFGRREIVKGATYSYFEFVSDQLLSDEEWLTKLEKQKRPPWVAPYVTDRNLPCPSAPPM